MFNILMSIRVVAISFLNVIFFLVACNFSVENQISGELSTCFLIIHTISFCQYWILLIRQLSFSPPLLSSQQPCECLDCGHTVNFMAEQELQAPQSTSSTLIITTIYHVCTIFCYGLENTYAVTTCHKRLLFQKVHDKENRIANKPFTTSHVSSFLVWKGQLCCWDLYICDDLIVPPATLILSTLVILRSSSIDTASLR